MDDYNHEEPNIAKACGLDLQEMEEHLKILDNIVRNKEVSHAIEALESSDMPLRMKLCGAALAAIYIDHRYNEERQKKIIEQLKTEGKNVISIYPNGKTEKHNGDRPLPNFNIPKDIN